MAWLRSKLRRVARVIVVVRGDNLKQGSFVDKKMLSILNKILIDKLSTGIFGYQSTLDKIWNLVK